MKSAASATLRRVPERTLKRCATADGAAYSLVTVRQWSYRRFEEVSIGGQSRWVEPAGRPPAVRSVSTRTRVAALQHAVLVTLVLGRAHGGVQPGSAGRGGGEGE